MGDDILFLLIFAASDFLHGHFGHLLGPTDESSEFFGGFAFDRVVRHRLIKGLIDRFFL